MHVCSRFMIIPIMVVMIPRRYRLTTTFTLLKVSLIRCLVFSTSRYLHVNLLNRGWLQSTPVVATVDTVA
jgi:hypothetical protein